MGQNLEHPGGDLSIAEKGYQSTGIYTPSFSSTEIDEERVPGIETIPYVRIYDCNSPPPP